MKLLSLIAVASLAAQANPLGPITSLAQLPEPSSAAMLVVGAFAIVIGLSGKRRQNEK